MWNRLEGAAAITRREYSLSCRFTMWPFPPHEGRAAVRASHTLLFETGTVESLWRCRCDGTAGSCTAQQRSPVGCPPVLLSPAVPALTTGWCPGELPST